MLVRAPARLPRETIDDFVLRHADWISRHLERQRRRQLSVPPPPTPEEIASLKEKALEVLPGKVAHWSQLMGVTPAGIKITAARKRYGSCSGKNSLCFSCFLMRCPEEAVDLKMCIRDRGAWKGLACRTECRFLGSNGICPR